MTEITTGPADGMSPVGDRPDAFISYAREDSDFVEGRLCRALVERGKDVWIDVEDIRGGASDWRASVWAGIEASSVVVFVLTPDSLASRVCGEELQRAVELNKRIIAVLHRSVDGLAAPPALERPNWIYARAEDDFDESVSALVAALELDEAWVDQHARYTQRTIEWLRHDRDASYLLRGSDLRAAERWLDDQGAHRESPTADQVAYITAGVREAARRQRLLLGGVGLALVVTTALAILAFIAQQRAEDRERTARAQARSAEAIAALSSDPEESLRRALDAVEIRADEPEADSALRRAVAAAGWISILRIAGEREGVSSAPVRDAEFAENGRRAASAAADGKVAVWDTRTARRLALVGHEEGVNTVQFSPDGRRLLTASEDGTARTWDASSGRRLHVLDTGSSDVWAATYGARGRLIITVTADRADVWDAASGSRIARLPSQGEHRGTIRLSLDGRHALTPGGDRGDAWLWTVSTRRRATLRGQGDPLTFAQFSRDGRRILTVDSANRTTVWATAGGEPRRPIARFRPRTGRVTDADLSSDGRRVVTAGADGEAQVWDVASRRRIARLRNGESVSSALLDRGGRHVVTGDDSGVVRVWNVATERLVTVLRGHTAAIRRARFSPDGSRVVTASDDGSARLWRALPQTPADRRWQHAESATFSPDSRLVLVTKGTRRAVWDIESGRIRQLPGGIYRMDTSDWPCGRAAGCSPWSPDGLRVAGADTDGRAVVWDAQTGASRRIGRPSQSVIAVAFSADGRRVAMVDGERKTAQIWNLAAGTPKFEATVPMHSGRRPTDDVLRSAQFLADPLRVLTVDAAGLAQLSDPAATSSVTLRGTVLPAAVAPSGDGEQVAIGTVDGELRVFSGRGQTLRARRAHDGAITSLAYDRAGTAIATGGQKGTTFIWDADTLVPTTLQAPGGEITGATFSRDGKLVLVTSGSIARLWDRAQRRVVLELPPTPQVRAELSPDASRIVIAGKTRLEVRSCEPCLPLDALVRVAQSRLPAP